VFLENLKQHWRLFEVNGYVGVQSDFELAQTNWSAAPSIQYGRQVLLQSLY
jgi:hypothetical protein